jgi:hypothetical protein
VPMVAAAVCPHPPLLVPELASGAAPELADLRAACDAAVAAVLAAEPAFLAIIGGATETEEFVFPFQASFAPWGVPVQRYLGRPDPASRPVPLSIGIGVWLLRRAIEAHLVRRPTTWLAFAVASSAPPGACAALGSGLDWDVPYALLVMGDGSACHGERSPGYDDPRAEPFDRAASAALADADTDALLALDSKLADELRVAGRAPWQVLAGAVAADARAWQGELLYDATPYGVGYFVATWSPTHPFPARS